MKKRIIPDAAESNAGDDFHIIWAIRKSLQLLNFDLSALKAVNIEGISKEDEKNLGESGDSLLGVDLTEYYGGKGFANAHTVVVSQLKYSTRNPDKNWTISELCKQKNKKNNSSLIYRLSSFYVRFAKSNGREQVLSKLTIKLVSNRPLAPAILSAITEAQRILKTKTDTVNLSVVTAKLGTSAKTILQNLSKNSGLKSQEFTDFLRVLDFKDCETDSRFTLKQQLIKAISQYKTDESRTQYAKLADLIRNKMLPEGREENAISITDILYEFGFADVIDLFPVVSRLQEPDWALRREQMDEIKSTIHATDDRPVILHGGAGIGKSTIVNLLQKELSVDSKVLTYDCYGNGAYLDSEDRRHLPENAILHLCNELAISTGVPFLLHRTLSPNLFIREFKKRIELACKYLLSTNPQALLIIIIDAADNSVHAAELSKENCFIDELMRMGIPEGCRLIFSSRTERLSTLPLPEFYKEVPISSFSLQETRQFVNRYFQSYKEEELTSFHDLTYQTPRVMSYAIDMPGIALKDKLKPLKPGGKRLDDIFRMRIKDAARKSGNKYQISSFLTSLIHLPRPVPSNYLQEVSSTTDMQLQDFRNDLWHGLIYNNGYFMFRDEDFENFLRAEYPSTPTLFQKICSLFLQNASSDDYASTHLGKALFQAGRKDELQSIVLDQKLLDYPIDPIKNKDVSIERTRLAMLAGTTDNNDLNIIKLQIVAAEAAKTNQVLEDILLNNAELASKFGNLQMNQKLYFQEGNPAWYGPVHFRNAAVYSRDIETHTLAREHLIKAEDWLVYRDTRTKKTDSFRVSALDIAYGAEAILNMAGIKKCMRWIDSWTPKAFRYKIIEQLLINLIEHSQKRQFNKWVSEARSARFDVQLLIIRICFLYGIKPPIDTKEILKKGQILMRFKQRFNIEFLPEIMSFCEFCLQNKIPYEEVKDWLALLPEEKFNRVPYFLHAEADIYEKKGVTNFDILFRKLCLKSVFEKKELDLSQFYPDTLRENLKSTKYETKNSANETKDNLDRWYKHILPIYKLRISFLLKLSARPKLKRELNAILSAIENDWDLAYRARYDLKYTFRFLALKILDISIYENSVDIITSVIKGFTLKDQDNIPINLAIANRISTNEHFHVKTLEILKTVENRIEEGTLSGQEQLEYFVEATYIASRISANTGKYYFDKMVLSSSEIDLEAFQQIKFVKSIAQSENIWNKSTTALQLSRFIEYCRERLKGYEDFPWTESIDAISRLDIGTSFAVLCQWDHGKVRNISKHLTEVLEEAIKQNFIDHKVAACLLTNNRYYWNGYINILKEIIKGFHKENDKKGINLFLKDFIHGLKLAFTPSSSLTLIKELDTIIQKDTLVDSTLKSDMTIYYQKLQILIGSKSDGGDKARRKNIRNDHYIGYLRRKDITNSSVLTAIITKLQKNRENSYVDFEEMFAFIRSKAKVNQYVGHLKALIELNPDLLNRWTFERVIKQTVQEWYFHPDVSIWAQNNFFQFVKDYFPYLINYDSFDIVQLREFAVAFGIQETVLAGMVRKIIPEYLNELSTKVLYQLVEVTTIDINQDSKQALLDWALNRWNKKLKSPLSNEDLDNHAILTSNPVSTIAEFIRYNLGHPDKRIRWRMAHSLRKLARFDKDEIFTHLLTKQDIQSCHPFQDKEFPFYWISAKLYLWLSIERIAHENASFLKPFASYIINTLSDKALPHVQIRYFVVSAGKTINRKIPKVFSTDEILIINKALSYKEVMKKRDRSRRYAERKTSRNTTFSFDLMDTVPYWYEPLSDALGCTTTDILKLADDYITNKWDYHGDGHTNDPGREADYHLTSHRHGSEPTVERLQTYFEYHAMFCAAGEILGNIGVVRDPDGYGNWKEWLDGWGLCWRGFWLADFRDPVPLERKFWITPEKNNEWEWNIGLQDFETMIGLSKPEDKTAILIRGGTRLQSDKDSESASVSSALIQPKLGRSLLLALQTSTGVNDYLPLEKDRDYEMYDDDYDAATPSLFKVKGWVLGLTTHREGIDDVDDFFNDIDKGRLRIGTEFSKWADLTFTNDYRYSFKKTGSKEWITKLESWNSHNKRESHGDFSSSGTRLYIKKKELLSFLKITNQSLIMTCSIKRHVDWNKSYEYYPHYTYILLIDQNGKVETLSRNYQLR